MSRKGRLQAAWSTADAVRAILAARKRANGVCWTNEQIARVGTIVVARVIEAEYEADRVRWVQAKLAARRAAA